MLALAQNLNLIARTGVQGRGSLLILQRTDEESWHHDPWSSSVEIESEREV
jgi:hypothetical protein